MNKPFSRHTGPAALVVAVLALVLSTTGLADAAKRAVTGASTKPRPLGVLKLNKKGKFPPGVIPKVRSARNADRLGGQSADDLTGRCNPEAVDIGTWCLLASPLPLDPEEVGQNDFFFATRRCAELGGYLPTAAQLLGAVDRVRLASTISDDRLTASVDEDTSDGTRDRREMSATLITTQAGSSAAGSQGVSDGSRGNPRTGEPDPAPQPAAPAPETLQYVTVFDNGDRGGFAGGKPVTQPENFRCAFDKAQGEQFAE